MVDTRLAEVIDRASFGIVISSKKPQDEIGMKADELYFSPLKWDSMTMEEGLVLLRGFIFFIAEQVLLTSKRENAGEKLSGFGQLLIDTGTTFKGFMNERG